MSSFLLFLRGFVTHSIQKDRKSLALENNLHRKPLSTKRMLAHFGPCWHLFLGNWLLEPFLGLQKAVVQEKGTNTAFPSQCCAPAARKNTAMSASQRLTFMILQKKKRTFKKKKTNAFPKPLLHCRNLERRSRSRSRWAAGVSSPILQVPFSSSSLSLLMCIPSHQQCGSLFQPSRPPSTDSSSPTRESFRCAWTNF